MGTALLSQHLRTDGTVLVELSGELDLDSEAGLGSVLVDLATNLRPVCLVVDLARVTFIDSTGISALMAGRDAAARNHVGFLVRAVTPPVERVLRVAGLYEALTGGA